MHGAPTTISLELHLTEGSLTGQAYNLDADQRPAAIAFPQNAEEVADVVRFARAQGLRVAPQRTGHNAVPLGSIEDAVLLKADRLQGARIDVDARRARVAGGAQWQDVVPQASELGLAALHGSTPDMTSALAPWDAGRYFNFVQEPADSASFYDEDTYRRLQAVKAAYDPEDVFRANHQIKGEDR